MFTGIKAQTPRTLAQMRHCATRYEMVLYLDTHYIRLGFFERKTKASLLRALVSAGRTLYANGEISKHDPDLDSPIHANTKAATMLGDRLRTVWSGHTERDVRSRIGD